MSTLALIAIMALTYFKAENFEPFLLEDKGISGTIEGATIVYFAYLGFDIITCLAEESKNPKKDMPKAIEWTMFICCVVYSLIAFSLTGMARLNLYPGDTAMAHAFSSVGSNWKSIVILISGFLGISASAFNTLMVSEP
jgi:amino acid transporter